jgi:hypothetical protein
MQRANPNKPETWTPAIKRGQAQVAEMRAEQRDEKYIAGMLYNTCQNVPKVHFQQFLNELGVKYNMAARKIVTE